MDLSSKWDWAALTSILLLVLAGIAWSLKTLLGGALESMGDRLVSVLGKRRRLGRKLLRKYRSAILKKDHAHPLGFLQSAVNLDAVYVPLKCDGGMPTDTYRQIRSAQRSVVLGDAGAGKSMLLRHSLLRWASNAAPTARVPIMIDLHLYNDPSKSLTLLVLDKLARRGIPEARSRIFFEHYLSRGRLSLLLDGFDEVTPLRRDLLTQEILDVSERYADLQIIVTCRDAIYRNELGETFEGRLRVLGFDNASIRRFLHLWFAERARRLDTTLNASQRSADASRQATQLILELSESPALLRLARSPLLLTMIASLEAEDPGLGPSVSQSQTEFYETMVSHLLRRDKDLNRYGTLANYRAGHKLLALSAVARAGKEGTMGNHDTQLINEIDALRCIGETLSRLRMDPLQHSGPMLDEIVTRSELLVRVNEESLMFAHLTIQEYLAAVGLGNDGDRLLRLFRADPDAWRQTVKLWCGMDHDGTRLISELFAGASIDKILALECLADARLIADSLAESVIGHFRSALLTESRVDHLIVKAMGSLIAEGGRRGEALFDFCQTVIEKPFGARGRLSAIACLAASRLPSAAAVLSNRIHDDYAINALRSMGDAAVPSLKSLAAQGASNAVDDLGSIGTPSAASALAVICLGRSRLAARAAWWLASLITDPEIEEHFRLTAVHTECAVVRQWIWHPFRTTDSKSENDAVSMIMGRVADLLVSSDVGDVPRSLPSIDPRLALPLVATYVRDRLSPHRVDILTAHAIKSLLATAGEEAVVRSRQPRLVVAKTLEKLASSDDAEVTLSVLKMIEERLILDRKMWRLATRLPTALRLMLWAEFFHGGDLSVDAWTRSRQSVTASRALDLVANFILISSVALLVLPGFIRTISSVVGYWVIWNQPSLSWGVLAISVAVVALTALSILIKREGLFIAALIITTFLLFYFILATIATGFEFLPPPLYGGILGVQVGGSFILQYLKARRRRLSHNSMRRLLVAAGKLSPDRTSVIAT